VGDSGVVGDILWGRWVGMVRIPRGEIREIVTPVGPETLCPIHGLRGSLEVESHNLGEVLTYRCCSACYPVPPTDEERFLGFAWGEVGIQG